MNWQEEEHYFTRGGFDFRLKYSMITSSVCRWKFSLERRDESGWTPLASKKGTYKYCFDLGTGEVLKLCIDSKHDNYQSEADALRQAHRCGLPTELPSQLAPDLNGFYQRKIIPLTSITESTPELEEALAKWNRTTKDLLVSVYDIRVANVGYCEETRSLLVIDCSVSCCDDNEAPFFTFSKYSRCVIRG